MKPQKCCNYTDNNSPTIDQIKAIETTWNKFINDYFKAVDDKYPSTDLTIISEPTVTIIRGADGNSKKNSNGQPMFKVENDDGDMVELAREEVNALRLKSHLHDTDDDEISHNATLITDKMGLMVGITITDQPLNNQTILDPVEAIKETPDESKTIVVSGLTELLANNKVTLRTHQGHFKFGDYQKEEIIIID